MDQDITALLTEVASTRFPPCGSTDCTCADIVVYYDYNTDRERHYITVQNGRKRAECFLEDRNLSSDALVLDAYEFVRRSLDETRLDLCKWASEDKF